MTQAVELGKLVLDATAGNKPRRNRISLRDEALLTWFFCEGQSVFERSTFGVLLDRQALFAFATKPCSRCDGGGFTDRDLQQSAECLSIARSAGIATGEWSKWRELVEGAEPRCSQCNGEGWVPELDSQGRQRRIPTAQPMRRACGPCSGSGKDGRAGDCARCKGQGLIGGYDAQCDGDDEWDRQEPRDDDLQRYAVVSRRLGRIAIESQTVLGAFYGPVGAYYGAHEFGSGRGAKVLGRLHGVFELTTAGRKLLRRLDTDKANPAGLHPCQLLATVALNQLQQPLEGRREQLEACRAQAQELYSRAVWRWNAARQGAALA